MAGTRGYYNYRGRKSKAKIALTVLLVLVILAAVVVMLLQRNIVYDETGTPRLELPWQAEEPAAVEGLPGPDDLDLTIEEAPVEELPSQIAMRAYALPVGVLTGAVWTEAEALAQTESCEAVAVTLKDSAGNVYFDTEAAVTYSVKTAEDSAETLEKITGEASDSYTIARISCFLDPKAGDSHTTTMGLMNTGGYIFYDGNNSRWIDPGKADARSYLSALIRDAAELGFDEILLTNVCYPLEGKLDKIQYGEGDRPQKLSSFLEEIRVMLEPYSVALSVEVTETVLAEGRDDTAGLVLEDVVSVVDRVYAQVSPEMVEAYAVVVEKANKAVSFVPELAAEKAGTLGRVLILK